METRDILISRQVAYKSIMDLIGAGVYTPDLANNSTELEAKITEHSVMILNEQNTKTAIDNQAK